jgi:glycerol-3-phosphate acyltransferase PlsY
MTGLVAALVAAYLLGSVSGSLALGRLRKVDIRTMGSGNAGGTNALRTQGKWFALGVVLIDVGKGALAAALLPPLSGSSAAWLPAACAMAAVIGHCYPLWHGFRGGKGAATAIGGLAAVWPWLLLPMFLAWVLTLALTGYVGLSTMVAALVLVPAALLLAAPAPVLWLALALALFIPFTHRSNIRKLRAGTENRFERARLLGRRRPGG